MRNWRARRISTDGGRVLLSICAEAQLRLLQDDLEQADVAVDKAVQSEKSDDIPEADDLLPVSRALLASAAGDYAQAEQTLAASLEGASQKSWSRLYARIQRHAYLCLLHCLSRSSQAFDRELVAYACRINGESKLQPEQLLVVVGLAQLQLQRGNLLLATEALRFVQQSSSLRALDRKLYLQPSMARLNRVLLIEHRLHTTPHQPRQTPRDWIARLSRSLLS